MLRLELASFWDEEIARWIRGDPLQQELLEWQTCYRGWKVNGQRGGMPEPFLGDLRGSPKAVLLGNNPGEADELWHGRNGRFPRRVAASSYTAWAASAPYRSSEWEAAKGENHYHASRRVFLETYLRRKLGPNDVVTLELYPWHSKRLAGAITVSERLLERFLIGPLRDFPPEVPIFAFGSLWAKSLDRAHTLVDPVAEVGGFRVASRRLRMYAIQGTSQRIVVMWQGGYAGPPASDEVALVRLHGDALARATTSRKHEMLAPIVEVGRRHGLCVERTRYGVMLRAHPRKVPVLTAWTDDRGQVTAYVPADAIAGLGTSVNAVLTLLGNGHHTLATTDEIVDLSRRFESALPADRRISRPTSH